MRHSRFASSAMIGALLWGLGAVAMAQDQPRQVQPRQVQPRQVQPGVDRPVVERETANARNNSMRGSQIIGMQVKNHEGKELATVEDIVVDVNSGKIRYAALSYGGFLGFGDKLFAVPWDVFEHRFDASKEAHMLVFNVDEQTLKTAPGFNKDNWPDFGSQQFMQGVDKHYNKFRRGDDVQRQTFRDPQLTPQQETDQPRR